MAYEPMDFSSLLGMNGFSDQLLRDHFKLYEGYVTNTNELLQKAEAMASEGKLDTAEFSELRRRLGWEFNGMRLHELYFGNLGGDGKPAAGGRGELNEYFSSSFGGFDAWLAEFKAVGSIRGIGWAILYYDDRADRIHDFWIGEHDVGHPAGCVPLLVMDVWEHAFMADYGTDRAPYIDAFLSNVDWKEVEKRLLAPNPSEVSAR
ncbi:MAG: superoxide dismutase [Vicinamibacteria bacterium]